MKRHPTSYANADKDGLDGDDGGPLFGRPPRQQHSETSCAAANSVEDAAGTLRALVFESILASGEAGMTDENIQEDCDMPGSTERPRRVELMKLGYVWDSGRKAKTKSGRAAVLWVAVPKKA